MPGRRDGPLCNWVWNEAQVGPSVVRRGGEDVLVGGNRVGRRAGYWATRIPDRDLRKHREPHSFLGPRGLGEKLKRVTLGLRQ